MLQVPKNNRFRKNKKQVRVGKNPKKEVEPIAPNSEAESQTKYATYVGIPIQVKKKINEEEAIPPPTKPGSVHRRVPADQAIDWAARSGTRVQHRPKLKQSQDTA